MINFITKHGRFFAFSLVAAWLIGNIVHYLRTGIFNWLNFIQQILLLVVFWKALSIGLRKLLREAGQTYSKKIVPKEKTLAREPVNHKTTSLWVRKLKKLTPKERIWRGIACIIIAVGLASGSISKPTPDETAAWLVVFAPIYVYAFLLGISFVSTRLVDWQLDNPKSVSRINAYYVISFFAYYGVILILFLVLGD